jgi:predicted RNase H-like HicB family nuclease
MEMIEILFLVLIAFNVYWAWINIRAAMAQRAARQEIMENIQEAYERFKNIIIMRVEKHDDMLYVYNQHTNEFICQGKTLEEVNENFGIKYPNRQALVDEGSELLFKEKMNVAK